MQVVGQAELRSTTDLLPVRDDVWMLPLPIPHAQPKYTLCYVIADARRGLHVIDPGLDLPANRALVERALEALGGIGRIATITATHLHADHVSLAGWLRERSGAPIGLHRRDADALRRTVDPNIQRRLNAEWAVPRARWPELAQAHAEASTSRVIRADLGLADGDLLAVPGRSLRVLATPGHTAGHISIIDEDHGLAFLGDLVLPRINPGFGLGDPDDGNPLRDLLSSLLRIAEFDDHEACPGHEHRFTGIRARSEQIIGHHLKRNSEVADVDAHRDGATIWEVAQALSWRTPFEQMSGGYLRSVLLQVSMHIGYLGRRVPS